MTFFVDTADTAIRSLADKGLAGFLADWAKTGQQIA
jgi:hypothetical protein